MFKFEGDLKMQRLEQKRKNYYKLTTVANSVLKGKLDKDIPKYACSSCTKCSNKWCSFFNRRVEPKFNKCFNHTFYHTVATKYQAPANLAERVNEEELKRTA